jgi:protoheme IX farnesyltransferase
MVLVTAWLGMLLAGGEAGSAAIVLMLTGVALVTAGASAFNQLAERRSDARMLRTENRPLPAGRIGAREVYAVAGSATLTGLVLLSLLPNAAAAVVAGVTFVLYVFIYTPAKRWTWLNTFIGAVPGAMPPLIGWAAARGTLTLDSLPLFAILFFWQVPHFLAIAWMYRDDYRRAGLRMLPVIDASGTRTARTMLMHTLALIAASLWPLAFGAGALYAVAAGALGLMFLALAASFARRPSVAAARKVLRMSLVYLPAVFLVLFLDRVL